MKEEDKLDLIVMKANQYGFKYEVRFGDTF